MRILRLRSGVRTIEEPAPITAKSRRHEDRWISAPERAFIGPGTFVLENGDILMAAPWGRPPTNFEQLAAKFPVPMLYRSQDGGRTWKEQGRMNMEWPLTGMVSDGGVSFLRLKDGRLAVLLHRHVKGLLGGGLPAISFSKDDGATWTPARLVGEPEGFWYVMNDRLIQLRKGRLLVPVAHRPKSPGAFEGDKCLGLCFFSDDGGETWKQSRTPAKLEDARGMAEPCVAEVGDRVLMLARTGSGYHFSSWSDDGGDTWSKPEATTLMSACSSLTLKTLPDGRLMVFYNHAAPIKAGAFFPRTPLCYAVSDDGGKTWGPPVIVDDEGVTDKDRQNIYPSVCFTKEGMLVIWSTHGADPKGSFAGQYDANIGGAKRAILAMPTTAAPKTAAKPTPQPVELAGSAKPADVDGKSYDLVVVGATPGGIACAVRAAREGLTVLLTHPYRHVGGMLSNGVLLWDTFYDGSRSPIHDEVKRAIQEHYRQTFGPESLQFRQSLPGHRLRDHQTGAFEPHVTLAIFERLLAESDRITVATEQVPTGVQRQGRQIVAVNLAPMLGGPVQTVRAKVFVDATYEGDLMALAGADFRIGREGRNEYDERYAGKLFARKGMATADGLNTSPRDAFEGRLNLRTWHNPTVEWLTQSTGEADGAVQAYNFRLCLSRNPENRVAVKRPPGYDRTAFSHLGKNHRIFVIGLINEKFGWNEPRPVGWNFDYPAADWSRRRTIQRRYLDYALGMLYYLQNDEAISPAARADNQKWGLAQDEFIDNDHLPEELYVREARRLVGRYVLRESDGLVAAGAGRTPVHADSIGFTEWPMDSVQCTTEKIRVADGQTVHEGAFFLSEESRPAMLPYRSLLPRELDNLLVPVCLSSTHVFWGAVRLEPVFMQTGESAGLAAALALKAKTTPAELNPAQLVRELATRRFMVSFFNDMDVAGNEPWILAAQYFGTKGFFADYNARMNEPLTEAVRSVWLAGFQQLQQGTLEAMKQAKAVHAAESKDSPDTGERRGDALLRLWKQLINKP